MPASDAQLERLSRKLRFLLSNERLTVPMLAEYLEVSRSTLQHVVDGKSMPPDALLRRLSNHFGVPESFFMGTGDSTAVKKNKGRTRAGGKSSKKKKPVLNLKAVATRHQALVELLVSKGLIKASEYQEAIQKTEDRRPAEPTR